MGGAPAGNESPNVPLQVAGKLIRVVAIKDAHKISHRSSCAREKVSREKCFDFSLMKFLATNG
jgi:hypothetical protein